jgi:hypothetical protein
MKSKRSPTQVKVCSRCGGESLRKQGRVCHVCRNLDQQERRRLNGNIHTKHYEKTPNGFLMRAYRNMESRVTGVQKERAHLYQGLNLLPRESFYIWAKDNPDFWRLYRHWVASGYDRKLTPSVNRIDPDKGYELDNIEWLTHSVNSALARHATYKALERVYALAS